jgi:uncharacterized membrane protein YkvA (DUF1232 family)
MAHNATSSPRGDSNKIDVIRHVRLVWRLLSDKRVSPWLKGLIPTLVLAYLLMPLDLIADFIPVLGQLDDLAVLLLGMQLFIELCPKGIVMEHLQGRSGGQAPASPADDDVVDAAYRVIGKDGS